jgi:hypothetical protein
MCSIEADRLTRICRAIEELASPPGRASHGGRGGDEGGAGDEAGAGDDGSRGAGAGGQGGAGADPADDGVSGEDLEFGENRLAAADGADRESVQAEQKAADGQTGLARQAAAERQTRQAADGLVAARVAAIWAMIAEADPELARRVPGYLDAAE